MTAIVITLFSVCIMLVVAAFLMACKLDEYEAELKLLKEHYRRQKMQKILISKEELSDRIRRAAYNNIESYIDNTEKDHDTEVAAHTAAIINFVADLDYEIDELTEVDE